MLKFCGAILNHSVYPEWVAPSDDEFVPIALDLAADQPRHIALRQSLRDELKASLLCNTHHSPPISRPRWSRCGRRAYEAKHLVKRHLLLVLRRHENWSS